MATLPQMILIILLSAFTALMTVKWIYFKILHIALSKNLVDNPDARKLQKRPVPVLGGIAVFAGVLSGIFAGMALIVYLGLEPTTLVAPILCGMGLMLYIGALDDIIGLSPLSRIVIEVLTMLGLIYAGGGCLDSFHGLWGIEAFSWWWGVPLTVISGVGIINAFNMIDGVNGLSSGLCILCSMLFGLVFVKSNDYSNAALAFSMAAALVPFFVHNVFGSYSRMFIGDAGTMVMGALMAWFTISIISKDSSVVYYSEATNRNMIALALAIQSVPVFDTLRVMTLRMLHGESPFHPDKTHLHHAFVLIGISHSVTTLSMLLMDFMVTILWMIAVVMGASCEMQLYVVVGASVLIVWGAYVFLRQNARHHTRLLHFLTRVGIKSQLARTDWWQSISRYLDGVTYKEDLPTQKSDKDLVLDFMKGKAEVYVEDIRKHSGADSDKVGHILQIAKEKGLVRIIREDSWGMPEIVCLL